MHVSRRSFLFTCLATQGVFAQTPQITAREVIQRIQNNVGVPWRTQTVDTFKAGDPDTPVKGIATSFGGTLDVLRKAVASGKNLIIVHEPTFYSHDDATKDLMGEVYRLKREFIDKNGLVIWRFHDHWHARKPDGILTGVVEALGWDKYRDEKNPRRYVLPTISLDKLARDIRDRMQIKTMRVIGDPNLQASRIVLSPGFNNLPGIMRAFDSPDVDVLVIGENNEWTGIELARDATTLGLKKGLIVMGHVPSEETGMKECARWLKTFIPEVPIEFIPSGEPFWTPKFP
jgi:putative NIF3 family GTP cyclohydrolase 1 type 2